MPGVPFHRPRALRTVSWAEDSWVRKLPGHWETQAIVVACDLLQVRRERLRSVLELPRRRHRAVSELRRAVSLVTQS